MSRRQRLVLTGTALVPALALVMARLLGWLDRLGSGDPALTGIPPDQVLARADDPPDRVFPEGPDWDASLAVTAVTLLITGLAVYFGSGGLDVRRGRVSVFVLGWGATALSATAGERLLRRLAPDKQDADPLGVFLYIPLKGTYSTISASQAYAYGLLFGWIVGLVLLVAFLRTRHTAHSQP
jgi:hypothetical protein